MRAIATAITLATLLASGAFAQGDVEVKTVSSSAGVAEATSPDYSAVYCSGFFTDDKVPAETRLISGEQSSNRVVFASGDHVFISKGSAQGVRVGDRFSIVREVKDPNEVQWFKWQGKLMKAMGARYLDTGQVESRQRSAKRLNGRYQIILRLFAARRHRCAVCQPPVSAV